MSRRAITGIKERIIIQTVNQCYTVGLANVSTKKVAAACGVTDTTIFNYFLTKRGWLDATFAYVKGQLCLHCSADCLKCKEKWQEFFDYLIKNPEIASFYAEYTLLHKESVFDKKYALLIQDAYGAHLTAEQARLIWLHFSDGTTKFALYIAQGALRDTPALRESIFSLLIASPLSLFQAV